MSLAQRIVDGLLDPDTDNMEMFVQGALTSDFSHFMLPGGKSSSWPSGVVGETFTKKIDSDDSMIRVTIQVSVDKVVGMSNPHKGTTNLRFFVSTKLNRWEAFFRHWDIRFDGLTDEEVAYAAQQTYIWLTQAVPRIINNRPQDVENEKSIPHRLEFQLKRALHALRKGEPYEPAIE